MFSQRANRFATFGVIANLPGELIDSVWMIIDQNLQGVIPLDPLLRFDIHNNQGKVTMHFSEDSSDTEMAVDLPFAYSSEFPDTVIAYDDGDNQTILLPEEAQNR